MITNEAYLSINNWGTRLFSLSTYSYQYLLLIIFIDTLSTFMVPVPTSPINKPKVRKATTAFNTMAATITTSKPKLANTFAATSVVSEYEEQLPAIVAIGRMAVTLAPPITSESVVHDNACGPGVVTNAVLTVFANTSGRPPRIIASDIVPGMVELAGKKSPTVEAHVMDAKRLDKIPDGILTHSFTNFLFVRGWGEDDMVAFASEIYRTLRPGGTACNAAWKYHEWHSVVRDALLKTRPDAEGWMPQQPWSREKVVSIFEKAGFEPGNISVTEVQHTPETPTEWDTDLWKQFIAAVNLAVMRNMNEGEKQLYLMNLAERIEEDKRNPAKFKWQAWILTATKNGQPEL